MQKKKEEKVTNTPFRLKSCYFKNPKGCWLNLQIDSFCVEIFQLAFVFLSIAVAPSLSINTMHKNILSFKSLSGHDF